MFSSYTQESLGKYSLYFFSAFFYFYISIIGCIYRLRLILVNSFFSAVFTDGKLGGGGLRFVGMLAFPGLFFRPAAAPRSGPTPGGGGRAAPRPLGVSRKGRAAILRRASEKPWRYIVFGFRNGRVVTYHLQVVFSNFFFFFFVEL